MAGDNPYKRHLCNRTLAILVAGRTSQSGIFFDSITDEEFADYTTVADNLNDKKLICCLYPQILQQVITDMKPDFARQFADLGAEIRINKEIRDWSLLFGLPADFLDLVAQINQIDRNTKYDCEVLTFDDYAHVVEGSDEQAYYCKLLHTSTTDDEPITGTNWETYWTLYDEDGTLGAPWIESWAYKASQSGNLLATSDYSNDPSTTVDGGIDSAYIEYLAYVQAGISDKPLYYPESFKNAFCTRLAAEMALDAKDYEQRRRLLEEYAMLAGPGFRAIQQDRKYIPPRVSIFTNSANLRLP
uniref:Uncharacterized protein n=1 Tax=viral metagenome TaxID=1070528 RepID=A0A6M3KBI2_9ZZZZ